MASTNPSWAAPSLARYRPAILALTALAAGCTIYYIHEQMWSSSKAAEVPLHRSNARRQRRRPRRRSSAGAHSYLAPGLTERSRYVPDVPWGTVPVSLDFLADATSDQETFGDHLFVSYNGERPYNGERLSFVNTLRRHMPLERDLRLAAASDPEAATIRKELEEAFLCFYFWQHLAPSPISDDQQASIIVQLKENGSFSAEMVIKVLQWHQSGVLTERIAWWEEHVEYRRQERYEVAQSNLQNSGNGDLASTMQALEGRDSVADADSEHSWREESRTNDGQDDSREGQNLGNLLWRIAEEQARKESYVHRGVTCNSCNAMPIKGIRYRCSNCVDYDLCEQCEALQIHPKTHLFYKVRIPAPFLGNSRQCQPIWYPGRPTTVTYSVPKEMMEKFKGETGYQAVEIEALWEQFRCLAATEWDDDPCEYNLAIDRRTFDKCFVPNTSTRPPPPNLIYDRAFSFYDVDNDGLIGFGEFIHGRAALTRKKADERWKRVFKGYDIDNDGFVDRKDFLRMFRAYYTLTKELTLDIVTGMEDDVSENGARDIVLGSQPLSSAFSGAIPPGERLRTSEGKRRDGHGDYQIYDDIGGAVDDRDHEVADPDEILADSTEAARFGHVQRKGIIGPWVGDVIKNDKWPPGAVTDVDLHKVLPDVTELKDVNDLQDQDSIRRAAHERVAREHQERQFVRRIALRNRKQRRSFYLEGENAVKEDRPAESDDGDNATSLRKMDKSRKDDLVRILGSTKAGELRVGLIESIKAMDWPVESPENLVNVVLDMITNDWGSREIIEDLSGYGSLQHDAIDFVARFDSLVSHISGTIDTPVPQEPAEEQRKSVPSSSSRRSRSSSKVRFRDDVGTDDEHESRSRATSISSRSIPVNERWGGFVPEPEKDVGREVLYQVTQEALNELLDPLFRLREDLALAELRTRCIRDRHRADIVAFVKNPTKIKFYLNVYQKRWRLKQQSLRHGCLGTQEIEETCDADELLTFMSRMETGVIDSLTGEQCSRCNTSEALTWIQAGQVCTSCGKPSAEVDNTDNLPVGCWSCGEHGVKPFLHCGKCGEPSKKILDEEEKLWGILRGSTEDVGREVIQDEGELKPTPNEDPEPIFPPRALGDLHSSVAAFNEANPQALEKTIAQKPLDDLLAESGYAAVSSSNTSSTLPQTPDPTLPQNRPIEIHESDQTLQLDGTSDITDSVLNTPQLSIHTTQTGFELGSLPIPDPTLPQNRPNSLAIPSPKPSKDIPTSTSTPELTPKATMTGVPSNDHLSQDQSLEETGMSPVKPDPDMLRYYAALDMLAAEDEERGGPGRLSFAEWEDVMKGEKGLALEFLGSWIEIASF